MSVFPSLLRVCIAVIILVSLPAPASLPLQSFESGASGASVGLPWQSTGLPAVLTDSDSATGEQALLLPAPTGTAVHQISIPAMVLGDHPAFVDLWIKPVARTLALHPENHAAAGQPVETSGVLYLDGAHFLFQRQANRYVVLALTQTADFQPVWLRLGGFAGSPADFEIEDTGGRSKDWLRLTIRRDLPGGAFDVWLNERLVAVDLALARLPASHEFCLLHRPAAITADGGLAPMLLDDFQATAHHPLYPDADRDALPDVWEAAFDTQFDPTLALSLDVTTPDRGTDADLDLVPKISEYFFGSRPNHSDSDGDGITDAVEIQHGLNPASRPDAAWDKDGDGFSNLAESQGQGNGNISLPPAGALTNVVYVKADHDGVQNGQFATPYRTLGAALASPYLTTGGRIVLRGDGGPLSHVSSDSPSAVGNGSLTISRAVSLVGVNMAQVHLQESSAFATVSIPGASAAPVLTCENIAFDSCWGDDGGVFRIVGTPGEVVIRNCRFTSCYASDDGGAIYAHAARLRIEDCWFEYSWSNGEGGAIHAEGGSQATVRRTHFQASSSDTDGGAVSVRGATVSPLVFESCVFQANAARRGGAVAAVDGADVTLLQCTLSGNAATLSGGGGGLYGSSTATLLSASGCLFWNNAANGVAHAHLAGGSAAVTYTSLSGWTTATGPSGIGNNGSDPLFRAGTLLPTSSLMLDSSNPAHTTSVDFLGNARWDAPGGAAGTLADRGAFEKQPDTDADGLSDDWEVRYALNPNDPADADADADQDGYSNHEEFIDKTDPRNTYSVKAPVIFVSPSSGQDWHPGPNPPTGTIASLFQGSRSHPFRSIRRAILACPAHRRIALLDGTYQGPSNTNIRLSENWSWVPHLATTSLTSPLSLDTKTIRGLNGASRVTLDGGGGSRLFDLALSAASMSSSVILQNLSLRRGVADLGGAIRATGSPGLGQLQLQGCVLSANRATSSGGALHVAGASLVLTKCSLHGNDAPRGGAVSLLDLSPAGFSSVSTASFSQCRFAYNLALAINGTLGQGGALSAQASTFSTFQTRFDHNHAERHGGALAILSASGYYPPSLGAGTVLDANTAVGRGGAIYCENSAITTTRVSFLANIAGLTRALGEGGAVFLAHPATSSFSSAGTSSRSSQFTATQFHQNIAGFRAGAMAVADTSPLLTNCAFTENEVDPISGWGGGVAVFWEAGQAAAPSLPIHSSTPRFVHSTFARNRGGLAGNLHSAPLTTPWLINALLSDGFTPPATPSLLGPRQLHGCLLAAPDGLLNSAEAEPARRNQFGTPAPAFDWFHLAAPVRPQSDTSSSTGGLEPSSTVSFTRPSTDIDGEGRPAAAPGKFTLMRGCDEPRDADIDGLPDWFETLALNFSPLDPASTLSHTHPVTPAMATLPTAQPTNNADADAYTLTQELLHGGRPDFPETAFSGRDSDGDGLADVFERLSPILDWQNPDVNGDGVLDGWAHLHFGSTSFDHHADSDGDGLSNEAEAAARTNPLKSDSDGDGIPDAWELATNSNPGDPDSDDDGRPDQWGQIPRDADGNLPAGLHQPSAAEPWYVEQSWSYFQLNPGNYFYDAQDELWGVDSMNSTFDSFMEPNRAFPLTGSVDVPDYCRILENTLGLHVPFQPAERVNPSLAFIANHQSSLQTSFALPVVDGFPALSPAIAALVGEAQTGSWTARWHEQLRLGQGVGYSPWSTGRAVQRWEPRSTSTSASHYIARFVPTYRLRCPLPNGAPHDVSLTFLRFRGRSAQTTQYFESPQPPDTSHPKGENGFSIEPVTLTLARGATSGNPVSLDPHQPTALSTTTPTLPAGYPSPTFFELTQVDMLMPFDLVAHKRGTVNAPGAPVPAGEGEYGYETVMMENADSESADQSTSRDCEETGNLSEYRKAHDDDLVKIVLRFPRSLKLPGYSLKLSHAGMEVDARESSPAEAIHTTPNSRLKFYRADGTRITNPTADLQIQDIANPPEAAYLSKILTEGSLILYIEGGLRFGDLPASRMTRLGGALLQWELWKGESKAVAPLLVYRGGFIRFLQPRGAPGVAGEFEFRDGKGRVRNESRGYLREFYQDETDLGNVIHTWSAKSGLLSGSRDYRVARAAGHVPPGWWIATYNELATIERQTHIDSGKVTNSGRSNERWKQSSFCRWQQDDPSPQYSVPWEYNASNNHDARIGRPTFTEYKFRLRAIGDTSSYARQGLLIHPDGKRNGTLGCIGVQSYRQCIDVINTLRSYNGLKIKVQLQ